MTTIGHNSDIAAARLKSIVERIEDREREKRNAGEDIKDLMKEAKSAGFETDVLRALLAERRKDSEEVATLQAKVALYRSAIAGLIGLPLGDAALARVA